MKVAIIPEREELLTRLIEVSDKHHLIERFYPLLLKHAGSAKNGPDIALIFALAVAEYTRGLPPMIGTILDTVGDDYMNAMTTDPEVAADAKAHRAKL